MADSSPVSRNDDAEAAFEAWWQKWRAANLYPNTQRMRDAARSVYESLAYSNIDRAVEMLREQGHLSTPSETELSAAPQGPQQEADTGVVESSTVKRLKARNESGSDTAPAVAASSDKNSGPEPAAWRYRRRNIGGDWRYADTEQQCNRTPNYEREPLYAAPSATSLPNEPTEAMIEAGRLAIMGMLEPMRTPRPKPTIAELEALLNAEDARQIHIAADGSVTELAPRTTTAREVAVTAYKAMVSATEGTAK